MLSPRHGSYGYHMGSYSVRRYCPWRSRSIACVAFAARPNSAAWSAKPICGPRTSSGRCSSGRGKIDPQAHLQHAGPAPGLGRRSAGNSASRQPRSACQAVLLFGIPDQKDSVGSSSWDDDGIVQEAVRCIKDRYRDLIVITDVCFCEYTDHGHCGVIRERAGQLEVDNDATVANLVKQAVSHARAGADIIAPSDMMDGRIGAIRRGLDLAGFEQVAIMAYSAKFASGYYGPFREAAESPPKFGDRKSYQMDPANAEEALREVALDVEEGADIVMVKPAATYLDILWRVKERFGLPTAAYHVSGEYSMIKAAAANGWIDEKNLCPGDHPGDQTRWRGP